MTANPRLYASDPSFHLNIPILNIHIANRIDAKTVRYGEMFNLITIQETCDDHLINYLLIIVY